MHSGANSELKKYSAGARSSTSGVRWNSLPIRARGMRGTPSWYLGSVRIYVVVDRPPQTGRGLASATMEREHLSYCRICAAACGITVTVEDDERIVRVRGDAQHP